MPLAKFANSDKWYVDFHYRGRRRKWAVSTSKRVASEFERNLLRLIDYRAQGLTVPPDILEWIEYQTTAMRRKFADLSLAATDSRGPSYLDLLDDYLERLALQELHPRHIQQVESKIRYILERQPLTSTGLATVMGELRQKRSATTANKYLAAARAFGSFLVDRGVVPANPVARTKRLVEADRRQRRALTPAETARLLAVESDMHDAYRIALETGLRLGEIRQLAKADVIAEGRQNAVRVRGSASKGRKPARQPFPTKSRTWWLKLAFPVFAPPDAAIRMRDDLKVAKVKFETAAGVADFHSLRHTYITRLALGNTPPAVLQRLARHADIRTTLAYYTHVDAAAMRKAVDEIISQHV